MAVTNNNTAATDNNPYLYRNGNVLLHSTHTISIVVVVFGIHRIGCVLSELIPTLHPLPLLLPPTPPPRLLQSLPNITTTITTQRPIDRRKHTTGLFEHQLGERIEASPNMEKTRSEEDNGDYDDEEEEDFNTDDSKKRTWKSKHNQECIAMEKNYT